MYRGGYRGGYPMTTLSQIRIIQEVNGQEIIDQDKDIEIERLQTTCASLNNKASVAEDLAMEIETMKRRLAYSEEMRQILKKCNEDLEQERVLNEKIRQQQEETIRQLEKDRESLENRRLMQEEVIATQELKRVDQEKTNNVLDEQN
jgi:hypothetical protein